MSRVEPSPFAWFPWAGAVLLGALAGYGTWVLTFHARAVCDAGFEPGHRFGLVFVMLPACVGGFAVYAVLAYGLGRSLLFRRAPAGLRECASLVLLLAVLMLLAWWCFATAGTPEAIHSYTRRCPPSNIPPWWPDWIPV